MDRTLPESSHSGGIWEKYCRGLLLGGGIALFASGVAVGHVATERADEGSVISLKVTDCLEHTMQPGELAIPVADQLASRAGARPNGKLADAIYASLNEQGLGRFEACYAGDQRWVVIDMNGNRK